MDKKFIIASKNNKKIFEMKEILKDLPFSVISMEEAGFYDNIPENGSTFEENSMLKAKAIYNKVKGIVIADDSGLEIDYLNGAPGIYSARYAGENATDTDKINKVLNQLVDVPDEKRSARFVCAISVIVDDKTSFTVRGTCEGFISSKPKGQNGFGYDPIFFIPKFNLSMAELSSTEKNKISHRANALSLMRQKLDKLL